ARETPTEFWPGRYGPGDGGRDRRGPSAGGVEKHLAEINFGDRGTSGGERRSGATAAGGLESAVQRDQVQPARRLGLDQSAARRRRDRARGERQRPRDTP